jgi:hypothetical protein
MRTVRDICGEWLPCLLPKMVKPMRGDPIGFDGHKAAEGRALQGQPEHRLLLIGVKT